ncbi:MAG: hypothetical protein AABZ06_03395 [Bdellovibrionota bacterium]
MKLIRKAAVLVIFLSLIIFQAGSSSADSTGNFIIRSNSFKELYNLDGRAAQPRNVPWAGSYWSFRHDGIADSSEQQPSPAGKYDNTFRQNGLAVKWEKENHSCSTLSGETKASCDGWWGHCNAWSAAAIKEPEPRHHTDFHGIKFTVADLKAYLTEIWMESGELFSGNTQKDKETDSWVYDDKSTTSLMSDGSATYYESFWDVTPRAFFLIMTNYVGILKMGLVIDRFTGDQVWNQPVVGYRILPIRTRDILQPITRNGRMIYPVFLRMKFYWANDEVYETHVSAPFDIKKTADSEDIESIITNGEDYAGRLLKFTLFFDEPVQVNTTGTEVLSSGRILSEGIWDHRVNKGYDLDSTHPDFIWLPTQLYKSAGSANPYVLPRNVYAIIGVGAGGGSSDTVSDTTYSFEYDKMPNISASFLYRLIRIAFNREGMIVDVGRDSGVGAANKIFVKVTLRKKISREAAIRILEEAGLAPAS